MAQPFAFPPPPPPPPKPAQSTFQSQPSRGQRGRGSFSAPPSNGRGQGQPFHSSQRGGYVTRGRGQNYNRGGGGYQHSQHAQTSPAHNATSPVHPDRPPTTYGQKRDHTTAFKYPTNDALRRSRPAAVPAVPSFGLDIDSLLTKKPEAQQGPPATAPKKSNWLGLTPAGRDGDSEDDDEGEEAKLADARATSGQVQFQYGGRTATLNTPEEIAAWIAERRKRWPTEAKREVAQKEAVEKQRKWREEKAARLEAAKAAAKARQEQWQRQKQEKEKSQIRQRMLKEQIQKARVLRVDGQSRSAAEVKTEKLRRKAEKIARQLKIAEAAVNKKIENDGVDVSIQETDLDALLDRVEKVASARIDGTIDDLDDVASDTSDEASSETEPSLDDDTSTSGSSSDSDSDSAPEESTSNRVAPDQVLPPARKGVPGASNSSDAKPICTTFAKTGRCNFGRRCHFKHEKRDKEAADTRVGSRRKGLYQIMVEKEKEEEQKRALQAIIALGEKGAFENAAAT